MTHKEVTITNKPSIVVTGKNNCLISFNFNGEVFKNDIFIITEEQYFNNEKKPRNIMYTQIYINHVEGNYAEAYNVDIGKSVVGKIKKGDTIYKLIFSRDDR
jgi:hypothetical protein